MYISEYIHIFYFILFLIYALAVTGLHRIRELFPVSVISIIVIGIWNFIGISLGLFRYNRPLLDIFGIPLFHLIWAGVAGIILIDYMKPRFSHNLLMLVSATVIIQVLAYVAELVGTFIRLGGYNYYHNAVIDFATLTVVLLLSESLYKYKVYNRK